MSLTEYESLTFRILWKSDSIMRFYITLNLTGAFSTFRKHLLRDRLCRTLFFHPFGAFL